MIGSGIAPGIAYRAVPPQTEPSPLRSDIAGFFGYTRRGPIGVRQRVEAWRGYTKMFGGLAADSFTTYAIRGYFENGGEIAHVVRLAAPGATAASATMRVPPSVGRGLPASSFRVVASSPGLWANDGEVTVDWRRRGVRGRTEVDVTIRIKDEPVEYLFALDPAELVDAVAAGSQLVRFIPADTTALTSTTGPQRWSWALVLRDGLDGDPTLDPSLYTATAFDAIQALHDEQEVALLVAPDFQVDPLIGDSERTELLLAMVEPAAAHHDRLVLVDAPRADMTIAELSQLSDNLRLQTADDPLLARCMALYHPWLEILDPLGGARHALRTVPPSGHVAGVISLLDRERGAHHTPANASIEQAFDVSARLEDEAQAVLNEQGVNLLRCMAAKGIQVWGGRTLDLANGKFVAHRRLIHRLVRAIRRVAEPLVFEVNGPELWLTFVRAITTVLLEAFRSGALQGDTPADAFRVRCDDTTNPPEVIDQGQCICEVSVAPARPMEFIVFKVTLLPSGAVEVIE